jgi:hypothetical protein
MEDVQLLEEIRRGNVCCVKITALLFLEKKLGLCACEWEDGDRP